MGIEIHSCEQKVGSRGKLTAVQEEKSWYNYITVLILIFSVFLIWTVGVYLEINSCHQKRKLRRKKRKNSEEFLKVSDNYYIKIQNYVE